jgi:lauroyl/myristoyl acyltransferase
VRFTGRWEIAGRDERWSKVLDAGEGVRLPPGAPRGRAEGLRRILNLLRAGAIVYLAADGPFGREAFHLEVPGGQVTVRLGWLALRRAVHVPTLPVLAHRQGHERVICVHPPLPDVDPDPGADAARCKTILEPLVHDYVRRFPSQCRYVVLPN